jgi:hypothetical protein
MYMCGFHALNDGALEESVMDAEIISPRMKTTRAYGILANFWDASKAEPS